MRAAPLIERRLSVTTVRARFETRYDYPVLFGRGLLAPDEPTLARVLATREPGRRHRVLFVLDQGLSDRRPELEPSLDAYAHAFSATIEPAAPPLTIPGGEACKNDPALLHHLYGCVDELGLDRHAYVVAIGGGAVLDVVGYAVATAHRGLRLVRMPSTVLAQGDSGVGVKNGINYFGKKNFVGTFAPPCAVLVDTDLLSSLELREMRAGYAEAVKVALLRDPAFFAWLRARSGPLAQGDGAAVARLVRRCAELHVEHIASSGDPFETGSSRPLDFGHWAAHKLESLTKNALRHGEAVAIGMALDTTYAALSGFCDDRLRASVLELLEALGLPIAHEALSHPRLLDGLDEFREHLGGDLTITLLREVGSPFDVNDIDRGLMARARAMLLARRLR